MYERSIRDEFTHQTETFARAPAMLSAEALGISLTRWRRV
jgi:hypothetical protein